jgi:signal transduction histidine kinase
MAVMIILFMDRVLEETIRVQMSLQSPGLIEEEMSKGGENPELKKYVRRIASAADTRDALLSNLRKRSQAGRSINTAQPVGFGIIAREAVDLFAQPVSRYGVRIETDPDFPVVNVDHVRIREVLVNLIGNAIRYRTKRPDPGIRIGIERRGNKPVFFVEDKGIGIESRYLERIFTLFEKLDASTRGTGAGLSDCETDHRCTRREDPGGTGSSKKGHDLPVHVAGCPAGQHR